ncbi:MAG: ComF family protein [Ignavibacteria bacterium]|nr:ComF family protein [Ignavibacteria bacterium]
MYQEMFGRLTSEAHVSRLVSAYHYEKDGTLQSLIHYLKYGGITALGVELGRRLGDCVQATLGGVLISGILPVPLHPTKRRERGYNQSEYICKGVQERTGLPVVEPLLMRRKYTKSQTELDIEQRRENVQDAFSVHKSFHRVIPDQTFLIVDDIITTGSTVDACAKVLIEHSAKQVFAASVALAN